MYTIVAAAKALYDQLGMMGEMSIDGDSFLDLWIYIILKANIKDLVGVVSGCGYHGWLFEAYTLHQVGVQTDFFALQ